MAKIITPTSIDVPLWRELVAGAAGGCRMIVLGPSGVGKTTFAQRFDHLVGVPHVEIDALHHGPSWTPRPEFLSEVEGFAATESWVTEWQYQSARPLLADRATVAVWLDYPRPVTMSRVIKRTIRRAVRREVLWNGNVEPPLWTVFADKTHVVRWSWQGIANYRKRAKQLSESHPELPIFRCAHPKNSRQLLAALEAPEPKR